MKAKNKLRDLQLWYPNVPRKLVMAKNITIQAKFVYIYMSCQSETFDFFLEPMSNELGIGTRTLSKYISELVSYGWLSKGEQKHKNGRLGAVDYTVNTSPKKVNTVVQKTDVSNTAVSNCAPKYNSSINTPIKQDSSINTPISNDNNEVDNKLSPNNNEGQKRFVKPTIKEIEDYIRQKNYHIEAEYFYNYYESVNWMRGKTKMKNWKSTLATWELRANPKEEKEEMQVDEIPADDIEAWNNNQKWMQVKTPRIAKVVTYQMFAKMRADAMWNNKLYAEVLMEIDRSEYDGDIVAEFNRLIDKHSKV